MTRPAKRQNMELIVLLFTTKVLGKGIKKVETGHNNMDNNF